MMKRIKRRLCQEYFPAFFPLGKKMKGIWYNNVQLRGGRKNSIKRNLILLDQEEEFDKEKSLYHIQFV